MWHHSLHQQLCISSNLPNECTCWCLQVGRWGEDLVFRHLVRQLEAEKQQRMYAASQQQLCGAAAGGSGRGYVPALSLSGTTGGSGPRAGSVAEDRVVWLNREHESYLPYDMYISHANESITYIEVKVRYGSI